MKRRTATVVYGAIPVVVLALAAGADSLPVVGDSLRVPYAAEGPGPTYNVLGDYEGEPIIEITGAPTGATSGHLNMTTVSVVHNMTLMQALHRWATTDDTFVPLDQIIPPGQTVEDVRETSTIQFNLSEAKATTAALTYVGKPVETFAAGTVDGSAASGVIAEGDVIVSVDGEKVSSPLEVTELVRRRKPGEQIHMRVREEKTGTEKDVEFTLGRHSTGSGTSVAFAGIQLGARPADGMEVTFNLSGVGGPSAGLIFTLALIDKLDDRELTGGAFIAGTGTIDYDGTVGMIGGISHKVEAAVNAGADVFLAPTGNCAEAVAKPHGQMLVLKADDLADAVNQIEAFKKGSGYTTCEQSLDS
ncbi:PDZ domain-containing protein [Corynebacterium mendelii]|uniref:PDZ domain-containing protein n=1 Tax=Corynebacterium mendelii TaxID=2765362 RepID=A0A939E029_9CORY|nr:PDZ domain-containing protein [Corynebacterium mendelii]